MSLLWGRTPGRSSWGHLQQRGHSHSAADAEGGDTVAGVPPGHRVNQGHHDPRPAATDGVPESNGAPVRVEPLGVDAELPLTRENLDGERLIDLHDVDRGEVQTRPRQDLADGGNGSDTHPCRVHTYGG